MDNDRRDYRKFRYSLYYRLPAFYGFCNNHFENYQYYLNNSFFLTGGNNQYVQIRSLALKICQGQ